MPYFNNERNNNSRRSDGRSAEPSSSRGGHGSSNIKQTSAAGVKYHHHHVLPQHYHNNSPTTTTSSISPKNTSSKVGAAVPRVPPPPPPPPISRGRNTSFLSGSSSQSHSHGSTSNRGRSLSLARQKRSHGGHSSSLRVSKHGEEKDVATSTNEDATILSPSNSSSSSSSTNNRRGRSLSNSRPGSRFAARQKGVSHPAPTSTSNGESPLQLPLIGTKGERRPRSQSRSSRLVEISSSNTSSKRQPRDRQQSRGESKAGDNLPISTTSRTSTDKPTSSSSTTRTRGRDIGRAVSKKESLEQKSFKTVMAVMAANSDVAANSATSHNASHNHHGAQQRSSRRTTTTTRGSSRGRSNSQGRSKKKNVVAPPPHPLPVGESIKKDQQQQQQQQATSSTISATTPAASTIRRNFVVEIDPINNAVVQVFEFSQDGTLPNKQDRDKKKEPAFIETIRQRYSGEKSNSSKPSSSSSRGPSSSSASRGRSSSRSRTTSSSSTREDTAVTASPSLSHQRNTKIVIESDEQDNVIQIFEFSDTGALPSPPSQPPSCESDELNTSTKRRDASPFTRREEALFAKEICQETTSPQDIPPEEFKPVLQATTRGLSQSFTCSRRPSSRAVAAATTGGALRSSLRTSTKNSEGRNTPIVSFAFDTDDTTHANNVSFALDNEQQVSSKLQPAASLDNTSDDKISDYFAEESITAQSRRSTSGRSVSFVNDHQGQVVEPNPKPSFLMSSLNSQDTSYGGEMRDQKSSSSSSSKTSSGSSSLSSSGKKLVSFLSDQNDRDNLEALRISMGSAGTNVDTSERTNNEPSTVRRSVSFLMDHQQDHGDRSTSFRSAKNNTQLSRSIVSQGSTPRAPLLPQQAPPTRGRSAVTRSIPNEDLPGFSRARRARSLPRSHCLVINDASSLTASVNKSQSDQHPPPVTRGRSSAADMTISTASTNNSIGPAQPRRQARSLSRTRNPMIIRDHVDFDPTSRRAPSLQDNYGKIFRSDALPFEKPPSHAQKSLITSYSTAETYVSALTIEEDDSLFTNETTQAVKEDDLFLNTDDPLMNSTLTIYESECDKDEQSLSLLSDPTSCMMMDQQMSTPFGAAGTVQQPRNNNNGVNMHITKGDSTIQEKKELKQERRSRIRQMFRSKRSVPLAQQQGSSQGNFVLDTSESTRETQRTEGDALVLDGAQHSLRQQHHHHQSGKQKSRLTRLLKR